MNAATGLCEDQYVGNLLESQARVQRDSWAEDETKEPAISRAGFSFYLTVFILDIVTQVSICDLGPEDSQVRRWLETCVV